MIRIILPLCFLALLAACSTPVGPQNIALIAPDGSAVPLIVEVADTPDAREQGLMGRETLESDHGMLFIFAEPGIQTFWMKDTLLPLDVIFFDAQGKYVSHASMTPCAEDPCPKFGSSGPAKIALEVNAGFVDQVTIQEGWQLALPVEN